MQAATDLKTDGSPSHDDISRYVSVLQISAYQFVKMSYEGGGHYQDGRFIVPHPRELEYNRRRALGFHKNYLQPISDARIDPIYDEEIPRYAANDKGEKVPEPLFDSFLLDCDNSGTTFGEFMNQEAHEAGLQGVSFIVMDSFPKSEISQAEQENIDSRKFPYIYQQHLDTLHSYRLDRFGKIEWIIFESHPEEVDKGNGKIETEKRYRKWTRTESQLFKEKTDPKGKAILGKGDIITLEPVEAPVLHNLGVVPVIPFYIVKKRDKKKLGVRSPFYDLAKLNWTIFNLDSETRELNRNQGFSILCIQGKPAANVSVGSQNICWVPMDANHMPDFASPDPNINKSLREYAGEIKEAIFEIAEQNGVTGVQREMSGEAKAWDFQAHGSILKTIAKAATKTEVRIANLFMLYTKKKFVYVSEYREDYTPRGSKAKLDIYDQVISHDIGPETNRLAYKKTVLTAFNDADPAELEPVMEEIKNLSEDELQSVGQTAPAALEGEAGEGENEGNLSAK